VIAFKDAIKKVNLGKGFGFDMEEPVSWFLIESPA
jgi:hypothetical protein